MGMRLSHLKRRFRRLRTRRAVRRRLRRFRALDGDYYHRRRSIFQEPGRLKKQSLPPRYISDPLLSEMTPVQARRVLTSLEEE